MNRRIRCLGAVMAAAGVSAAVAAARAEPCTLELKKLTGHSRSSFPGLESLFRMTSSQNFWMQVGVERTDEEATAFPKLIKKEPAKYECAHPFRAVAKLGTQQYCFVLDSTKLARGYDRLYFDRNHNGDLTDDEVIKARKQDGSFWGDNYAQREFPCVDVTLDLDGTKVEYAFFLSVFSNMGSEEKHVSASLNAAAYRTGELTLDGKQRRIVLLDYNSNGRFDDAFRIDEAVTMSDGQVYPTAGDMLFIDPDASGGNPWARDVASRDDQHHVSKLLNVDGRFYNLKITPAGDKLSLEPSSLPLGQVVNRNEGYRAVVCGEQGFLKINGGPGRPAVLPEGSWRLLSYTIDQTKRKTPKSAPADEAKDKVTAQKDEGDKAGETDKKEPAKKGSLFKRLAMVVTGGDEDDESSRSFFMGPPVTLVSATATKDYKAVKVTKGQTVELPFGPPYHPLVKAPYSRGKGLAQLEMVLVGSAGEVCTNLVVNGNRPGDPSFAIATPDGEIVERGKFEYG